MDAANVIFHQAKRRVYIWNETQARQMPPADERDYADDEEALQQAEGGQASRSHDTLPGPVPPEVEPVLEENPKWHLLQEVLDEVEQEIHFNVDASGKFWCKYGRVKSCSLFRLALSLTCSWYKYKQTREQAIRF